MYFPWQHKTRLLLDQCFIPLIHMETFFTVSIVIQQNFQEKKRDNRKHQILKHSQLQVQLARKTRDLVVVLPIRILILHSHSCFKLKLEYCHLENVLKRIALPLAWLCFSFLSIYFFRFENAFKASLGVSVSAQAFQSHQIHTKL